MLGCFYSLSLEYSLSCVLLFLGSGILGIAFDDFTISVLDIETRKIVRTFSGHHGQINDMVIVNSFSVIHTEGVYTGDIHRYLSDFADGGFLCMY